MQNKLKLNLAAERDMNSLEGMEDPLEDDNNSSIFSLPLAGRVEKLQPPTSRSHSNLSDFYQCTTEDDVFGPENFATALQGF